MCINNHDIYAGIATYATHTQLAMASQFFLSVCYTYKTVKEYVKSLAFYIEMIFFCKLIKCEK